jgi:7-cyano-7-deazaguanine synthase in queuosine biosynthesis
MNNCLEKEYKKICAVIVTYGDRAKLVARVSQKCLEENLGKVILIDNDLDKNFWRFR